MSSFQVSGVTQGQRAISSRRAELVHASIRLEYSASADPESPGRQAFLERKALQPELKELPRCIRLYLAGYPQDPNTSLFEDLPDALGSAVSNVSKMLP